MTKYRIKANLIETIMQQRMQIIKLYHGINVILNVLR